jgi:hypothetical protein
MDKLRVPENKNVKMAYVLTQNPNQTAKTMVAAHRQNVVKMVNVFLVTQNHQIVMGKLGAIAHQIVVVKMIFVALMVLASHVPSLIAVAKGSLAIRYGVGARPVMKEMNQTNMACVGHGIVVVIMSRLLARNTIVIGFKTI